MMTSRRSMALAFSLLVLVACSSTSGIVVDGGGGTDGKAPLADGSMPGSDGGPSVDGGSPSSCAPANVQGYIPKWTPPAKPQSACTREQLAQYGDCLDASDNTSAACAPWFGLDASANSGCKKCVTDSKQTDPAWGPIVDVGTSGADRQLNVSGCVAIVTMDNGSGCAGNFQAFQECEADACADNCQGASSMALDACISAADTGGCSNYLAPASCVNEAGAGTSPCFASGTYGQEFAALAAVFCLAADGG